MCGLVGLVGSNNVAPDIYDALTVLQHRGQDAAGIMTCDKGRFSLRKDEGLVRDVFRQQHMQRLEGNVGIGHVRYPTAGTSGPALAQPFYVNSPYGIALAHNGNLTNVEQLTKELFQDDLRHLNTDSDSEVLLNVFAHEMQTLGKLSPGPDDIFQAVSAVHKRCVGGYAGLESHVGHALAKKQQRAFGGVLSFEVKGDQDQAWQVIDGTRIMSLTANLGDAKTTIVHPATTTHGRLSDEQREEAGIGRNLIRVSVGLEDVNDLKADLQRNPAANRL